jgi:hypothetical protein
VKGTVFRSRSRSTRGGRAAGQGQGSRDWRRQKGRGKAAMPETGGRRGFLFPTQLRAEDSGAPRKVGSWAGVSDIRSGFQNWIVTKKNKILVIPLNFIKFDKIQ